VSRFISHAQNFEDVLLWRALKHVTPGRYVDVGAQDPAIDSVSLAFHERGWHGVHVEPMPDYAAALRERRQGDLVIQAAVGTATGSIQLHAIAETGLSTVDKTIADAHRERGFQARTIQVPSITLDEVFVAAAGEVHWLKIDVEGGERDVIASWQNDEIRPWLVVVESTIPLGTASSHQAWEPMLFAKGYRFALFDGLNRFYVSGDHLELLDALRAGANVFDNFALSGDASAPFCAVVNQHVETLRDEAAARDQAWAVRHEALEQQLAKLQKVRRLLDAEVVTQTRAAVTAQAHAKALRIELESVYTSTSWRITRPLRGVRRALSAGGVRGLVAAVTRRTVVRAMKFALARPGVKRRVMGVLSRHPGLLVRLQRFAVRAGMAQSMGAFEASRGRPIPAHIANGLLSLKAGKVLQDLQQVIKDKQS
jgi:FkbM family methyltransferase